MDLQQTINQLEKQAAQYTEAANTLRALQQQSGGAQTASVSKSATKASAAKATRKYSAKKGPGKGNRGRKKGPVSEETRNKISEALRASHAARKALSARK